MAINGSIDNILDLTKIPNIRSLSKELRLLNDPYDVLGQLVTASTGGTYFTDGLGAYAYERGYSGVMFFSARNIDEVHRADLQSEGYYHEDDAQTFKEYTFSAMFAQSTNRCIVLFDGAETVRSIKRFTISGLARGVNPFHEMASEAILAMSEHYGAAYQAERKRHRGCPSFLLSERRCLRCITAET